MSDPTVSAAADPTGAAAAEAARRAHYGDFYAGPEATLGAHPDQDPPVLLVVGNCQAESLRLLLAGPDVRTVRMPAVHELTEDDVASLHAWVRRTAYLIAQPVRDDYRDLPVGTGQLDALLPDDGRLVLLPSLRYAGLYPYHVIVHLPPPDAGDPPVVPYHDLRTVVAAAWATADRPAPTPPSLTAEGVRFVADDSLAELRSREDRHGTVTVSDLLERPTFASMRTVNHPGNALLVPVAERLRAAAGLEPHPPEIDRPLLNDLHAPRLPAVAGVFDPDAEPQPDWRVGGEPVSEATVAAAQLPWYAARPTLVAETLRRHADTCVALGLTLP